MSDMDEYIVETREGVAAAIQAAAQPTFEAAKQNPFVVVCDTARYTFKEGVTDRRADAIVANIHKVSKRYFEVR